MAHIRQLARQNELREKALNVASLLVHELKLEVNKGGDADQTAEGLREPEGGLSSARGVIKSRKQRYNLQSQEP